MYCIDENRPHIFHVLLGPRKKPRIACGKGKIGRLLDQPPGDLVLCEDCTYAVNPGRRAVEKSQATKRSALLVPPFRTSRTEPPRAVRPLKGQGTLFGE